MKAPALALAAALLAAGCTTPQPTSQGDLNGPQALAVSNGELFIANTNTDELRVFVLDANNRRFVAAPNPLFVLSIPVVTRPIALAADTDGAAEGKFIFALSTVASRLGAVDREKKVELQEVALPGTPLSMAARTLPDGGALVLVGVSLGHRGSVVAVRFPPIDQLPAPGLKVTTFADLGTAAPAALVVSPDGNTVAVGDRLADESGADPAQRTGGVILLDATGQLGLDEPKAVSQHRVEVGGPVGRLAYGPASKDESGAAIPAGKYLFASVESSGCALATRCGGIQVLVDGAVPETAPGVKQSPVELPGVPTDLAVAPGALLNLPPGAGYGGPATIPELVAVPSTDGKVYFLDGTGARLFDINSAPPSASGVSHFDSNGAPIGTYDGGTDFTGPTGIQLAEGAIGSETVVVTFQGKLPALSNRAATLAGDVLSDPGLDFATAGAQVGDPVSFSSCSYTGTVAALGPAAGQLQLTPAPPADCAAAGSTYTVRVPDLEYTVVGSLEGLLGRARANADFQGPANYYYRPRGFDPTQPGLRFKMGSGQVTSAPDEFWLFTVDSGVVPFYSTGGDTAIMPGPVAWSPGLSKFYVGYPGSTRGSQISEIDPTLVVPGVNSTVGEQY